MKKNISSYAALVVFFLLFTCCGGCATLSPGKSNLPANESGPPLPAPTRKAAAIIATARSVIGCPYLWGGTSPQRGFDCSGLVWWTFSQHGIHLPRPSWELYATGQKIKKNAIRPGDIIFFRLTSGKSLHVGIITERRTFIHSPKSGSHVMESSMDSPYWRKHYLGTRRLF